MPYALPRSNHASLTGAIAMALTLLAPPASVSAQDGAIKPQSPLSCAPEGDVRFLCGINTPEDIAMVPGTSWLVSGSFVPDKNGGLYAIDSTRPALTRIYPAPGAEARPDLKTYPDCTTPPDPGKFAALGLSIRPRLGGGATLYAIGHGSRDGVEVFELSTGTGTPKATWVGCVLAPPGATLNGVAGMNAGEILTTAIFEAPSTFGDVMAGKVTGNVYARQPGQPFRKLENTALSGNNGIEITRDHRWLFVAATGTRQVLRYERTDTTKKPEAVSLTFSPDNLRWSPDGRLLVAGQERQATCPSGPPCPALANVAAIDPATMTATIIARFPVTAHWGGLSGAAIAGKVLWLGAHQGDRIAYLPLKP